MTYNQLKEFDRLNDCLEFLCDLFVDWTLWTWFLILKIHHYFTLPPHHPCMASNKRNLMLMICHTQREDKPKQNMSRWTWKIQSGVKKKKKKRKRNQNKIYVQIEFIETDRTRRDCKTSFWKKPIHTHAIPSGEKQRKKKKKNERKEKKRKKMTDRRNVVENCQIVKTPSTHSLTRTHTIIIQISVWIFFSFGFQPLLGTKT